MTGIKQKYLSKFSLSALFLDLRFCKNLGFSLSEHCEWGTMRWDFEKKLRSEI
jgi:hypothetical protein